MPSKLISNLGSHQTDQAIRFVQVAFGSSHMSMLKPLLKNAASVERDLGWYANVGDVDAGGGFNAHGA